MFTMDLGSTFPTSNNYIRFYSIGGTGEMVQVLEEVRHHACVVYKAKSASHCILNISAEDRGTLIQ
jgi:hypothetical protein